MKQHKIIHGGDIYQAARRTGRAPEEILDFSGNINPLGISENLKDHISQHLGQMGHYPDMEYRELRRIIADYAGCGPEQVMVGNGGTELISLIFRALNPKKVLIPSPTFSEYERGLSLLGVDISPYRIKEELDFQLDGTGVVEELSQGYDLLILCNPNNPTGKLIDRENLLHILEYSREHKIHILVDETFIEFVEDLPAVSILGELPQYKNVIVLRGLSKFFAVPGIRLGYLIADEHITGTIHKFKDPWSVNTIADLAGRYLLQDTVGLAQSHQWIKAERKYLYDALQEFQSLKVYTSDANFFLVKLTKETLDSTFVRDKLEEKGILIRDLAGFYYLDKTFIRMAIHTRENNLALICALREMMD